MCDHSESSEPHSSHERIQVFLDGLIVPLPREATSLASIRFLLETMALEHNRILCGLRVDGAMVNLADSLANHGPFLRVEGETIDVAQMPLQLVQTALQQCSQARGHLEQAITRVMINGPANARQLWWSLATELKHPLLTLSLVPDSACHLGQASASVLQLRKWQLQQLATVMKEVDELAGADDPTWLSNGLERRVFPWLAGLERSLQLLQETLLATQWTPCEVLSHPPGAGPASFKDLAVPFFGTTRPRSGQRLD